MSTDSWSKAAQEMRLKGWSHEATLPGPMGSMAEEQSVPDDRLQLEKGLRLTERGIMKGLPRLLRRVKEYPKLGTQPQAIGGPKAISQLCENQKDD